MAIIGAYSIASGSQEKSIRLVYKLIPTLYELHGQLYGLDPESLDSYGALFRSWCDALESYSIASGSQQESTEPNDA
jgi:hypothetical protein